ncbi:MAG: tetratricopeptide repeat protein [Calothrix sp. C42_A2020_038]|nr:tetratricopeptide repeat protein [Calothrix sp. C42_A2020_038]
MTNQPDSDKQKSSEEQTRNIDKNIDKNKNIDKFTILSGIALCIWLVPGIGIILQIFINTRSPNIPNHNSNLTYEQVTQIVDKKTQETYSLINILLFVITALPIAGNYYFWLLYKSVRNGLIEDSTHGLDEKINANVQKELDEKIPHYIKEEKLRDEIAKILQEKTDILKNPIVEILQDKTDILKNPIVEILQDKTDILKNPIVEILQEKTDILKNPISKEINDMLNNMLKDYITSIKTDISKILEQTKDNNMLKDYITSIKTEILNQLKDNNNYYFNFGMEKYLQGNYEEAIEEYEKAIGKDQKYYLAWYYKGEAYRQLGNDYAAQNNDNEASKNYLSAINAYKEVTKNSQLHLAFFYKAICYASIKQNQPAFESLYEAIKLHEQYKQRSLEYPPFKLIIESDSPYEKACLYAILDEKEQALNCLKEALEKTEDKAEKARMKEQVKKSNYFNQIKTSYDKACLYAILDEKEQALSYLKEALEKTEDKAEKTRMKEQVQKSNYFDQIKTSYDKACLYAILDEKEQALSYLKEALEKEDKAGKARMKEQVKNSKYFDQIKTSYDKACLYAVLDEKEQALSYLKEALEKTEDKAEKARIKEQVKKSNYFDQIKTSEDYKDRFQKLIEEEASDGATDTPSEEAGI